MQIGLHILEILYVLIDLCVCTFLYTHIPQLCELCAYANSVLIYALTIIRCHQVKQQCGLFPVILDDFTVLILYKNWSMECFSSNIFFLLRAEDFQKEQPTTH